MTEKTLGEWMAWFEKTYPDCRPQNAQNPYEVAARPTEDPLIASKNDPFAIRQLQDQVRGLKATVGALIDLLAASGALDHAKLRERFGERMQDLLSQPPPVATATGVKVVHAKECRHCGATNRGDAATCAKCERTLR